MVPHLRPSGGIAVVRDHARALASMPDFEPELLVEDRRAVVEDIAGVPVRGFAEAASRGYDMAIATWWETLAPLYGIEARLRVLFAQSFEERFYHEADRTERLAVAVATALPDASLTVAPWMAELLAQLRPGTPSLVVPNGIDKDVFVPRRGRGGGGPLRVLVEGQPSLWFKGVQDALAAVRAMSESAEVTVVALDPEEGRGLDADRVVGGLDAPGMADLYGHTDVLVKLSRFEALGLAPLEAMHVGVPCLVTPYTGSEEYMQHGHNGVVVGIDDLPAVTAWLDRLASDRELLARLSEGALRTAAGWPSREASSEVLAAALREIADTAIASPRGMAARVMDRLAFARATDRVWHEAREADLVTLRRAREEASAHVEELSRSRDECGELLAVREEELTAVYAERDQAYETLEAVRAELAEIWASRAFRAATLPRRARERLRR